MIEEHDIVSIYDGAYIGEIIAIGDFDEYIGCRRYRVKMLEGRNSPRKWVNETSIEEARLDAPLEWSIETIRGRFATTDASRVMTIRSGNNRVVLESFPHQPLHCFVGSKSVDVSETPDGVAVSYYVNHDNGVTERIHWRKYESMDAAVRPIWQYLHL